MTDYSDLLRRLRERGNTDDGVLSHDEDFIEAANAIELESKAADMIAEERDAWEKRAKELEADNAALQPLLLALRHIDWVQIILNQSAPCCSIRCDGRFCGRAERWAGHEHFHKFISLNDAIKAAMREGKEKL